jgi:hypothetical protein
MMVRVVVLLEVVMQRDQQSRAAEWGWCNTLRKKLVEHKLIDWPALLCRSLAIGASDLTLISKP